MTSVEAKEKAGPEAGSLGALLEGGWAPHGFFRRTMFEAFLARRVPPQRALWFARCLYVSRNRFAPCSTSSHAK